MAASKQQFWIDGYNVIHRLFRDGSLESRRNELVLRAAGLNQICRIFFDSKDFAPMKKERISGRVQVEYSRNQSADDLILDRLGACKDRRGIVVVTDDRDLKTKCHFWGVTTIGVRQFGDLLLPTTQPKSVEDEKTRDRKLSRSEVDEWLRFFGKKPKSDDPE